MSDNKQITILLSNIEYKLDKILKGIAKQEPKDS